MLHKYDKLFAVSLLAIAVASGPSLTASAAGPSCGLADGYGTGVVAYVGEVEACLTRTDATRPDLESGLFDATGNARTNAGLAPLDRRASLDIAAEAHALDMATRGYAAHEDLEGRDHLYRIRALDRRVLAGETGANIVVLDADTDAAAAFAALAGDEVNAANMLYAGFTDMGMGAATLNGKKGATASWDLTDAGGKRLAAGDTMRLREVSLQGVDDGYLNVLVRSATNDVYVLKGPLLAGN